MNQVDDPDLAATWGDAPITLGGEGVPLIAYGCVAEFGTVIGTSTNGARAYLADALEIAHRLPTVYALTQAGKLPVWKARRIAGQSIVLTPEAAAALDAQVAPVAASLSATATERLVAEIIATFMPAYSQELADASSVHGVTIDHRQVSFLGTSTIYGALDLADALDLEDAVTRDAEALKEAGCDAPLGVRRAMALGRLARGEAAAGVTGRQVTLYVHLPADTGNPTATAENRGPHLLTQTQVAAWCGNPDVKVVVKPVIDLHDRLSTSAYVVPDRIREHLNLRDRTCVFPFCTRPARGCQNDHLDPFDPDGPAGQTNTDNLGCLCGHHHNLKTHGGWTYTMVEPGVFLWRSPHGYQYLRDHTGTEDLSPPPVDPPGS
ncbi:MAG: endonuclease [Marmoricola sp.]|nr:endonuclease [Marmoricola sp.]